MQANQEALYRARTDGHVAPYNDISIAQLTRYNGQLLAGFGMFDKEHVIRQQFTEPSMDLPYGSRCGRIIGSPPLVDPLLNSDVSPGFQLKIAPLGISAVIAVQRPFDIDRMCVMSLNKIAVVAVHRAN